MFHRPEVKDYASSLDLDGDIKRKDAGPGFFAVHAKRDGDRSNYPVHLFLRRIKAPSYILGIQNPGNLIN